MGMAQRYAQRIQANSRFSARFAPCMQVTLVHLAQAQTRIDRLAGEAVILPVQSGFWQGPRHGEAQPLFLRFQFTGNSRQ